MSPNESSIEVRTRPSAVIWPAGAAVVLSLVPSVGQIDKCLGPVWALAAAALGACLIAAIVGWSRRQVAPGAAEASSGRPILWISAVLVGAFLILYPLSRSGLIGGGSDRADALDVTLGALLAGHYPYHVVTYLGNPPTPMPGAMLLALPFYALGSSAFQNLFWLPLFAVLSPSLVGGRRAAIAMLLTLILFSPGAMQDFVTGGDYLVNAIYVAVAVHLVMTKAQAAPSWARLGLYVFYAVTLSSRPIYIVTLPILTAWLIQR